MKNPPAEAVSVSNLISDALYLQEVSPDTFADFEAQLSLPDGHTQLNVLYGTDPGSSVGERFTVLSKASIEIHTGRMANVYPLADCSYEIGFDGKVRFSDHSEENEAIMTIEGLRNVLEREAPDDPELYERFESVIDEIQLKHVTDRQPIVEFLESIDAHQAGSDDVKRLAYMILESFADAGVEPAMLEKLRELELSKDGDRTAKLFDELVFLAVRRHDVVSRAHMRLDSNRDLSIFSRVSPGGVDGLYVQLDIKQDQYVLEHRWVFKTDQPPDYVTLTRLDGVDSFSQQDAIRHNCAALNAVNKARENGETLANIEDLLVLRGLLDHARKVLQDGSAF